MSGCGCFWLLPRQCRRRQNAPLHLSLLCRPLIPLHRPNHSCLARCRSKPPCRLFPFLKPCTRGILLRHWLVFQGPSTVFFCCFFFFAFTGLGKRGASVWSRRSRLCVCERTACPPPPPTPSLKTIKTQGARATRNDEKGRQGGASFVAGHVFVVDSHLLSAAIYATACLFSFSSGRIPGATDRFLTCVRVCGIATR